MKISKTQKAETSLQQLTAKTIALPKAQLKGVKGGIVEEDAVGI